jgi:hypothetical protein
MDIDILTLNLNPLLEMRLGPTPSRTPRMLAMSGQRSGPNQYFAGALTQTGAVPEAICFLVAFWSGISVELSDRRERLDRETGGLRAPCLQCFQIH